MTSLNLKNFFTTGLICSLVMAETAYASCESDFAAKVADTMSRYSTPCPLPPVSVAVAGYFVPFTYTRQNYQVVAAHFYSCEPFEYKWTADIISYPLCSSYSSQAVKDNMDIQTVGMKCGSIVHADNQVVGESVPIVGASFSMNYFSNWVPGRLGDYKLTAPLAGATPRDTIDSFDIDLKVGGSTVYSTNLLNAPNLTFTYQWDGLDSLGNLALGVRKYEVMITERRGSISIPVRSVMTLGGLKAKVLGLGGWLPSNYNYYDVGASTLYKGDGTSRPLKAIANSGGYYIPESDGSVVYFFDSSGRQTSIKTGFIGATLYSFNYDLQGRLSSIDEPFGRTTTFNRDGSGNFISITSPKGQVTSVVLNTNGYIQSFTNPNSETHSMTYVDANGLLSTFTKPAGQVSTFTYDANGNLIKDAHSGGYFFELAKTLNAAYYSEITSTSRMGTQEKYRISANYRQGVQSSLMTRTAPYESYYISEGSTSAVVTHKKFGDEVQRTYSQDSRFGNLPIFESSTKYTYDNVTKNIDRSRSYTLSNPSDPFSINTYSLNTTQGSLNVATTYNSSTKTFSNSTGLGRTSKTKIDSYERVISEQQGTLTPVEYTYTDDKITKVKQGIRETNLGYDVLTGFLSTVTNPLGQTTGYSYDSSGRVISSVLPDLRVVGYSYDSNGNMTGVTPPGRLMHAFGFNSSELGSSYTPPLLSGVSPIHTAYTYNDDKLLTKISKPTGDINFGYSLTTGNLTSISTSASSCTVSISSINRLPSSINCPGKSMVAISYMGTQPISYSVYNSANTSIGSYYKAIGLNNLVTSVTMNAGSSSDQIQYTYDSDLVLKKVGALNITINTPNGMLAGTSIGTSPNIVTDSYTYNSFGEIAGYQASHGSTVLYTSSLTRDDLGRVVSKTETMNGVTNSYDYDFDSVGRLTQVDKNSALASTYGYDDNSNRVSGLIGSQTTTGVYDAQDRMSSYNMFTYAYNANGDLQSKTNILTSTTTSFTYDLFGNLTTVVLPSSTVISYEADALNRRMGKKVGGVLQARWFYSDQIRIEAELNAAGSIAKRFVYGSKKNIPDYMIMGGENYRIISDHLGSPRLVIKISDGSVVQRMNHDEFGRVTEDTNPGLLPFGFAGGLYDPDTGLVRFGARDYDPEVGRWTSKDPILFRGGDTNLFGYVQNDPVNFIDPLGLYQICSRPLNMAGGSSLQSMDPTLSHQYIKFDDGSTASYGNSGINPITGPGTQLKESGAGATCSKNIKVGDTVENRMKEYAKKRYSQPYHLLNNNCQQFVGDVILNGSGL